MNYTELQEQGIKGYNEPKTISQIDWKKVLKDTKKEYGGNKGWDSIYQEVFNIVKSKVEKQL